MTNSTLNNSLLLEKSFGGTSDFGKGTSSTGRSGNNDGTQTRRPSSLNIAFCTVPMMGHFSPLIPYVVELLHRGHHITFFHESSKKYRQILERSIQEDEHDLMKRCKSVTFDAPSGGEITSMKQWGDILYHGILSHYHNNDDDEVETEGQRKRIKDQPDVMVYDFFATDGADAMDSLCYKNNKLGSTILLNKEQPSIPSIGVFPNPRSINPWAATVEEQSTMTWNLWCHFMWFMEGILARILWCQRSYKRWKRDLPFLVEQDYYPSPWMPRTMIGCTSKYLEFSNVPYAPLYHMVGPSLPPNFNKNKNLDEYLVEPNLLEWVQSNHHRSIVYVSFGTMYKHTKMSAQKMQQELLDLIDESKHNVAVLWSLPKEQQALLDFEEETKQKSNSLGHGTSSEPTRNVSNSLLRMESFVPQIPLLQSGYIQVFVTHCGSNSVYESLLSGVPMVCCPSMADQPANATRLVRAGVAVIAKKSNNSKHSIKMAINQVLNDYSSFAHASQTLATKLRAEESAKQAADIIEHVARQHQSKLIACSEQQPTRGRLPCGTALLVAGVVLTPILYQFRSTT